MWCLREKRTTLPRKKTFLSLLVASTQTLYLPRFVQTMPTVRAVYVVNGKLVASVAVAPGTDMGLSRVSKDSRLASGLFALSIMVQPLASMTLRTD